jgi:hypothetical protein
MTWTISKGATPCPERHLSSWCEQKPRIAHSLSATVCLSTNAHLPDGRPEKMPQHHQLGAKKGAEPSRPIADAALGWGASVRIDPGVTTGATCCRSGHHDAGRMLRRAETVAGSGDEGGDVAAADKPELTEAQKTITKKREELARALERLRSPGLRQGIARELRKHVASSFSLCERAVWTAL